MLSCAEAQRRSHAELEGHDQDGPSAKKPCTTYTPLSDQNGSQIPHSAESSTQDDTPLSPHVIDPTSQKHGPMFQALTREEQGWLLELHRNLRHPGSAKLITFCKQLQCPDHLLKGSDMRCSTCQETKGPVIA